MIFRTAQYSLFVLSLLDAQVTVTPKDARLIPGASKDFNSSASANWFVNDIAGGNSSVGQVNAAGRYIAPAVVPANNIVTLKAVSKANSTRTGTATITLLQQTASIRSVSPSRPAAGKEVELTVTATGFLATAKVQINGMAWPTTASPSAGTLKAKGTFPAAGVYALTILNPGPGSTMSDPFNLTVTAPDPPPAAVTVSVTPGAATVALAATRQFTATVSNSSNTMVTWSATAGSISSTGLYTAPAAMPASPPVTVRATSSADTTKFATATVTLQSGSIGVTPATVTVTLGTTQQFTATAATTWSATAGTITATGLYTPPATMPASPAVTIRATSTADATKFAIAAVTLQSATPPAPNPGLLTAARLLDQAAFGPTPQSLADVHAWGAAAWIEDQFNAPETALSLTGDLRAQMLSRLSQAPDQLRQRMVWALSQIVVVSMDKNNYANEYIPYLQILSRNAFGNYRTLLKEIAISPQMGKYLDLANSNKPDSSGGGANENFPRELLQLFTIGLVELNTDGSPKPGPVPTYNQETVRQFALALTGWTYPTAPGATPRSNNWEEFSKPAMEPRPANHDTSAKVLLNNVVLPAGQTPEQDMDGVIDCVFNHPNAGPFLATRLIRFLVTSNPSPAYIARVAQVFNSNSNGIRGDLKSVVRAILMDPEARNDQATANQGRLKDPVGMFVSFVRALNGRISPANQITWTFSRVGQTLTAPPSVFSYYSPMYRLPGNPALFGPEFQIYTPTESILLGNEIYQLLGNPSGDPTIDLSPFQAAAGNVQNLVDLVCTKLHHGRTPAGLRAAIAKAVQAAYDNKQRIDIAIYLAALSGEFAVQY
jgi:uncharacterized protein (DUF1800 family)